MTDKADLDTKDLPDESSSKSKSVDYEAKYRGLSKKLTTTQTDLEKLQEMYDSAQAEVEIAKSQARNGSKDLQKQLDELQKQHKDAIDTASKWEKQAKLYESKESSRKLLTEKFPQLVELNDLGDLRNSTEFEKPEDYESYLTRMATRITSSKQNNPDPAQLERQRFSGTSPNIDLQTRSSSQGRSVDTILDEIASLNVRDKDYEKTRAVLDNEMAEIQLREGVRWGK